MSAPRIALVGLGTAVGGQLLVGVAAVPPEWTERALCAQTDPEAFFPDKGGSTRAAKRICNGDDEHAGCDVRDDCLAYALEHQERFGIWGGMSERERRIMTRGDHL